MADKKISALTAATTPLAGTEVLPIVQSGATVKVSVDNLTTGKTVPADKFYALSTSTTPIDIRRSVANNTSLANVSDSPSLSNANYVLFGIDTTGGSVGYSTGGAFVSTGANGTGTARPLILHTYGNNDIVFARQNTAIGSITANGFAPAAGKGIDFSADPSAAGMTSELLDDYEEGTWTPTVSGFGSPTYITQNGKYTKVGNLVHITGKLHFSGASGASAISIGGLPYASADASDAFQRASCFVEGDWAGALTFITSYGMFRTNGTSLQGVKNSAGSSALAIASDFSATASFNFSLTYYV